MTPSRPRYDLIERLTDTLLRESVATDAPVPIEQIVRGQGIMVRLMDLKEISGLVVRNNNQTVIGVNRGHPLTRRRFTLAHELAHALIHEGQEVHYDKDFRVDFRSGMSSLGVDIVEVEANFFAAAILMPWRFLEADPLVGNLDLEKGDEGVANLAARYKVSPHAMSIRLGNLAARARGFASR